MQATKIAINSWLLNRWKNVDKCIKNHGIENMVQLEEEIKIIQIEFDENGPNGPYREAFYLDFINRCIGDVSEFLIEDVNMKFSIYKMENENKLNLIQKELDNTKNMLKSTENEYKSKMSEINNHKQCLQHEIENYQEKLMDAELKHETIDTE